MSYERGWQAISLDMPDRIPHTEYVSHWPYVRKVTGLDPRDPEQAGEAMRRLVELWDFDFLWMNLAPPHQPRLTHMGSCHWYEGQETPDDRDYRFRDPQEVLDFDSVERIGVPDVEELVPYFQSAWRSAQDAHPTCVVPGGYYNTIFSWCILTFGWEMFLSAAALDEDRFDQVLEGFFRVSYASYRAQSMTDMKAFICHDDIVWTQGAVCHPRWYREHVFPRYRRLWAPLKDEGIKVLFCSDGDFTEFVDDIADAGADGFIFEPMTDLEYVVRHYGQTHVIIGNIDCRVLMRGTRDDVFAEVRRCADLGRDCPGYFFAVGNHIPYNIPIENVEAYAEAIRVLGRR